MLVTQNDAGEGFDFDIPHGIALMLREIANLLLRELDVLYITPRQLGEAGLDLGIGQPVVRTIPFVERDRQFTHRDIAAFFDIRENDFDGRANLRLVLGALRRVAASFQMLNHPYHPEII
jgi:hypothetical protein